MRSPLLSLMRRESRGARGRLLFMTSCLALGVTAVTGVAALIGAVEGAVERDARALLAADVTVESRRALDDETESLLEELSAETGLVRDAARITELAAMVRAAGADDVEEASQEAPATLVEIKATDTKYPLYGALVTEPAGHSPGALSEREAIVAPELFSQLGIGLGDALEIGGERFEVVAELVDEPDRVDFAMTLGPRVFLSEPGLERTGLVRFGSRVKYKRLVAVRGEDAKEAARSFVDTVRAGTTDASYLRFKTFDRPSPGLSRALDNVGAYLGLVALLSLLLGGIGVAQVVRAWLGSRSAAIATLRSLGFRPREVFFAYFGHVMVLALLGCAVGIGVGLAIPYVVRAFSPELMESGAGGLQWGAAARGLLLGLGTAAVFSIPPLTAVWRVSPARVLRSEAAPLPAPRVVRVSSAVALVAGVFTFAFVQSGEVDEALVFTGGLAVLVAVLAGAAALASRLARRAPRAGLSPTLRHGVSALARPGAGVMGAAVALGLGTLVVVSLGLIGGRLEEELINGAPPDAPTVFLVDVQPDQWDSVRAIMLDEGAENLDSTPVVMARLSSVNDRSVADLLKERGRGRSQWLLTREQRLTWSEELPGGSELVAGDLWSDPDANEVSVEAGYAETLGVGIGDTLTYDVQGVPLELRVTSLRTVDWASFQINFYLLVEPGAAENAPGWRLAAATIPEANEGTLQARVAGAHPNVNVLRVRPLLERVAATLGRIAFAVRLLGGFTVLTGIAILAGAIAASSLRRGSEAALLKTLGVTRRGVALLFGVEFGLLGALAGCFGALGALVLSWVFLDRTLDMPGMPNVWSVPVAAVATAVLAMLAGLSSSARALRASPMNTLR